MEECDIDIDIDIVMQQEKLTAEWMKAWENAAECDSVQQSPIRVPCTMLQADACMSFLGNSLHSLAVFGGRRHQYRSDHRVAKSAPEIVYFGRASEVVH